MDIDWNRCISWVLNSDPNYTNINEYIHRNKHEIYDVIWYIEF